ncbi:hypothetical protein IAR55_006064 [Kwoniella newhampshirensis]|uniref:Erythromycin biosynthesis protein CIII-like C-terminal domain-containing protein n=1 Tax=Kwoniella newhampshirensis TaxID=1651941 RepID=A0AAW0YID7_9TREE
MSKPKVLFLTCPERGQSNVHLSVLDWLVREHKDEVELHLGSFESMRPLVKGDCTFHPITGKGLADYEKRSDSDEDSSHSMNLGMVSQPPGMIGCLRAFTAIFSVMHPESPQDYLDTARDIERLLAELNPTLVAIDSLLDAAKDALIASKRPFVVLSPNTIREVGAAVQGLATFKWAACGTGYTFPVAWYLYPINVFCTLFPLIWLTFFDRRSKALVKARNAAGYPGPLPMFIHPLEFDTCNKVLCMSTPEVEIPAVFPNSIACCGPILHDYKPFEQVDHKLRSTLLPAGASENSVVFISLGSHFKATKRYAETMLAAIRVLLDKRKDVQVIWKLRKWGDYELQGIEEVKDRLIIVDWVQMDQLSLLESGLIGCYVHHGGSNSYHEALAMGVPQIVMPAWLDCYDFANRAEHFGIGLWGNKRSAPGNSLPEFTEALLAVMGRQKDDSQAIRYRERAREISAIVTKDHQSSGGQVAAACIWDEMKAVLG